MAARIRSTAIPQPTVKKVEDARKRFIAGEPRNLFYLVATELIDLSIKKTTKVSPKLCTQFDLSGCAVSFGCHDLF